MWENALEKLKILKYEERFCATRGKKQFNRVHFVYPSQNASNQFDDFIDLCSWLCAEISHDPSCFKRDQYDDPNTVANKLMLALRGLDFRLSFPSQKLKTAHGEAICSVLEFLTDKALAEQGFQWGTPVYADSGDVEQAAVDDEADNDIEDEAAQDGVEEDVLFEEIVRTDVAEASLDSSAHNILHAQVDPIEWKTELERVGPKLRAQQNLSTYNEWRSHVDQTITNKSQIEKVLGDTQTDLQTMHRGVSEELSRMQTKERYINNQFSPLCMEFKDIKRKLEELQSKGGKANEVVAKLTNELSEVTEKLDDLKESFESKDSGIHDTSPLVRIKASLQQIKSEVNQFDLRIGVISNTLLASKISSTNRRRRGAANKAKQRHTKGKRTEEVDDVLSGGED